MIDMTGAWKFAGTGGFTIPGTTIKLDLFSDGARDYYKGLFGQSASGGEPMLPMEADGGIGDGAGPIPVDGPIPVEPDGGIGDGAGPILLDGPIPVEPDGGIGDGADPLPDLLDGEEAADGGASEGGVVTILPHPLPVDADGGIGDGAGPLENEGDDVVIILPVDSDGGIGDGAGPIGDDGDDVVTILPVDSDGGIGDGAGPIGDDGDDVVTILPVDSDGGIGDGAGPPPALEPGEGATIDGGGEGTKADDVFIASEKADTFVFFEGHGNDTILGFDVASDRLDFSNSEIDFTDLDSLLAHATDQVDTVDDSFVLGVYIETGEGTGVFLDGISSADLASAMIDF